MSDARALLLDHLGGGVTTVCRAWLLTRTDGVAYGFTDHDLDLVFEGQVFKASTGLTARVLQQTTGLSVDNSEALGGLSDAAVTEADLMAGRFDAAEVRSWLVNWQDTGQRIEQFRGNFGEVVRAGGSFRAELRGLTDRLNQPQGRVFHRNCGAILGDLKCRFDLDRPGYRADAIILGFDKLGGLLLEGAATPADRWFERGTVVVLTGAAAGLRGLIKTDRVAARGRTIGLWYPLGAALQAGDQLRLEAGCDKTAPTCQTKFDNFLNFRGFPDIPGEDWLSSYPVSSKPNDGGSLG